MIAGTKEIGFKGNIPELTGFRTYGMTVVFMAHLLPITRSWWRAQSGVFAWTSMDLFFVVSGFLIAGILLDSRSKPDYYKRFYVRRSLRILPAYYILLTAVALQFVIFREDYWQMLNKWGSPLWFYIYSGNIKEAIAGAWPTVGGLIPLWSLQIEEQFYIAFPVIVKKLRNEILARWMWGLVFLSPILRIATYWWKPDNSFIQYVLLPCRMEGLALGALIAIRCRKGPWRLNGKMITALTVALYLITISASMWSTKMASGEVWSTPFGRTMAPLIGSLAGACFLLWMLRFQGTLATNWLRWRPIMYFATISYGTYLYHNAVANAFRFFCHKYQLPFAPDSMFKFVIEVVLALGCASLSWHLIESPMINIKDRFSLKKKTPKEKKEMMTGFLAAHSESHHA
jgi:peptidoglycan/LPS O-acetylase OafA/YrhL